MSTSPNSPTDQLDPTDATAADGHLDQLVVALEDPEELLGGEWQGHAELRAESRLSAGSGLLPGSRRRCAAAIGKGGGRCPDHAEHHQRVCTDRRGAAIRGKWSSLPPRLRVRAPVPSEIRTWLYRQLSQDVCPWNVRFASELPDDSPHAPREVVAGKDARTFAREILQMTQPEFSAAFKGSPMKRAKLRGLTRNAAVVLGNVGRLTTWTCSWARSRTTSRSCASMRRGRSGGLVRQPRPQRSTTAWPWSLTRQSAPCWPRARDALAPSAR